ncbi:MAG: hypothetical protein Q4C95_00310 [Planctomycetia bacterium]|nr:hypothetical protein [Planctomycetia bacterium]
MSKSDSENKSNKKNKKEKAEEKKKKKKKLSDYCLFFLWRFILLILLIFSLIYLFKNDLTKYYSFVSDPSNVSLTEMNENIKYVKGLFGPNISETKGILENDIQSQPTDFIPSRELFSNSQPLEIQIIRIASWNLYPFDLNKLTDIKKSQRIAQLFLEFDIIAVQGIRSKNQTVLDGMIYLLKQNGGNYDYAYSSTISKSSEYLAYFYNQDRIQLDRETLVDLSDSEGRLTYPALIASFRPLASDVNRAFTFSLVNIWIDPKREAKDRNALLNIYQTVRNTTGRFGIAEDDVILLGCFNAPILEIGDLSRAAQLVAVHIDKATHWNGTSFDNICFNEKATVEYIERYGVVDLSHYFNISEDAAKEISDHRPIWADFSIFEGGQ